MRAYQTSSSSGPISKTLTLNPTTPLPPTATSLPPTSLLIKTHTTALNPIDYKLAELPPFLRYFIFGSATAIPGLDFSGTVVATGSDADALKPGQLVFGHLDDPSKYGTLAEYTIASKSGCVAVPDGVSPTDAACIGTAGLTAYQSLASYVKAGDQVFINGGSGGTGVFGIQVAKALGCRVVTSCSGANGEFCRGLGADEIIDYRTQDVVAVLKGKGKVFDLVVDNVGGSSGLYWDAHHFLKEGGRVVQVGTGVSLGSIYQLASRMLWPGWLGGCQRGITVLMAKNHEGELKQLAEWMREGKVKAVVDEVFGMDEKGAVRAFVKLKTGRARGKILVRVGG